MLAAPAPAAAQSSDDNPGEADGAPAEAPGVGDRDWIGVPLSGAPLVAALTDNVMLGRPPSGPVFVLVFEPGGSVTFVDARPARIEGAWQIVGERVCVQWPDAPLPACQRVFLDGDRLTFADAEGGATITTALRLDPPDWAVPFLPAP
jgi:hypothetical protein